MLFLTLNRVASSRTKLCSLLFAYRLSSKDPLLELKKCPDLSILTRDTLYHVNIVMTESWMYDEFKEVPHRQCLGSALCLEDVD